MSSSVNQPLAGGSILLQGSLVDKNGQPTQGFQKWLNDLQTRVQKSLDQQGSLQGTIGTSATIAGRTAALANVVQTLSNVGTLNTESLTSTAAVAGNVLAYTAAGWVPQNPAQAAITIAKLAHEWLDSYNAATGNFTQSQPAFADIGGTVAAGQLPTPTPASLGGIESVAPVANEWINSINNAGVPQLSQPGFANLSGSATPAQLPAATGAAEGILQLAGDLGGTAASPQVVGITNAVQKASAYLNTATNYAAGSTQTLVPIDTVVFDPAGIVSTAGHKITPTEAGYYLVIGNVASGAANAILVAQVAKNGVTTPCAVYGNEIASSATGVISNVIGILQMNGTTDYLQLYALNTSANVAAAALQAQLNLLTILGPF